MRAKRASIASQTRRFARLAQVPFDFAQGRLSRLQKRRSLGMTIRLHERLLEMTIQLHRWPNL